LLIFWELGGKEVKDIAYLFLGSINPAFENTTLGVGDKLALKAISGAYGIPEQEVKKRGSSLFLMDKMLFQFTRIGFCDDIHTKQRRAKKGIQGQGTLGMLCLN